MKTKHEKSFEQDVLERYSWKISMEKYPKVVNKIGLYSGCISAIVLCLVWFFWKPNLSSMPSTLRAFAGICCISAMFGLCVMALSIQFISNYFVSDKWRQSFLDTMSQDQKREVVAAAITDRIEKCTKYLVASGKSIQNAHKEIISSTKAIKGYQDEIRKLQELSETIKTKTL